MPALLAPVPFPEHLHCLDIRAVIQPARFVKGKFVIRISGLATHVWHGGGLPGLPFTLQRRRASDTKSRPLSHKMVLEACRKH